MKDFQDCLHEGSIVKTLILPESLYSWSPIVEYFPNYWVWKYDGTRPEPPTPPKYYLDNEEWGRPSLRPDVYEWIIENAEDDWGTTALATLKVYRLAILFANENDLVKFKLRWIG